MSTELEADYGKGLSALGLNCTLKKSPERSHTEALMNRVLELMVEHGVETEILRPVDYAIKFGVSSDEGDGDEWPQVLEKVKSADIILMGMSIWFGVRSSVAQMVIERLDGTYEERNEAGQYPLYNKVAGVVVTGNEDGAHASAETTLFNLTHLGCVVPPNADTYWVGDAGPGPSYLDAGGPEHPYTQRTSSWCAHNLLHMAVILRDQPDPADRQHAGRDGWRRRPRRVEATPRRGNRPRRRSFDGSGGAETGAGQGLGVASSDFLSAAIAAKVDLRLAAAALVSDAERGPLVGHVLVSPLAEGHQHRIEVEPLLGEPVAVAGADLILVGLAAEDPGVHQPAESLAEQRARDVERSLEVVESLDPGEGLAEDHQRPPVAEQAGRPGDRASLLCELRGAHGRQNSDTAFGIRTLYLAS